MPYRTFRPGTGIPPRGAFAPAAVRRGRFVRRDTGWDANTPLTLRAGAGPGHGSATRLSEGVNPPMDHDDNRRVLAVLRYLQDTAAPAPGR